MDAQPSSPVLYVPTSSTPTRIHSSILHGAYDFNKEPEDFPRIDLKDPSKLSYPVPGENSTNNFGFIWDRLFDDMVEITSAEPSQFVAEGLFLNKIDRAFTTTPPHAWLTVRPAINTIIKADDAHANGLSDHAMQLISVSLHAPPNLNTMPIKAEVFKHRMFTKPW